MSDAALAVLSAFDALPEAEREEVVQTLIGRTVPDYGPLPDEGLLEIMDEVFCMYDAEEAAQEAARAAQERHAG